ncbi:8-amino-7-oxononanoate synthase [Streptomyces rimosus subsp. rimosus]
MHQDDPVPPAPRGGPPPPYDAPVEPVADRRGAGARTAAFGWIDAAREQRRRAGLVRTLRPRPVESPLLDLASNDYLGLARHPEVTRGAAQAAHRWGAGATGSRLVSGSTELHARLEAELADFCGFEAALVLSSGYAANLAAVTALGGPGGLIVSDAGNHASLIDGSGSPGPPWWSRTPSPTRYARPWTARRPALAVTDAVYSVDGDAAPLRSLADGCRAHGQALLVDDAHGLGVLGDGGRGTLHAGRAGRGRGRGRHRDPVRSPSAAGGRGPRTGPGHRAPGQHRADVRLRHRAGPRGGRRGPYSAALAAPRAGAREPGPRGGGRDCTSGSPRPG